MSSQINDEQWAAALSVLYGFDRDRDDAAETLAAIADALTLTAPPSRQPNRP